MINGKQTYKIYINDKELILIPDSILSEFSFDSSFLVLPYQGNKKTLFQYLDTLENSNRFSAIVLFAPDVKKLFEDLKSLLQTIHAGGGLILNDKDEILMIFRRKFWDLPKGKLDAGENFRQAAVRECMEETGLKNLELIDRLHISYHIFKDKTGKRALKKTKWYSMRYAGGQELTPQAEEDIEEAAWHSLESAINLKPIFQSILETLRIYKNSIPG